MRTTMLAVAVASAFAPALSHAADAKLTTTLYGIVSLDAVAATDVFDSVSGKSDTRFSIDNGAQSPSRIGFKGNRDLNPDLKITFGIEGGFKPDTGENASSTALFNRGTYLGLSGKFGSVTAGRQWNLNDDNMGNFFVFGGYAVFRFSEFGDVSNLFNNSLKYYTPTFGGVQAGVLFGAGEAAGSSNGGNTVEAIVTYGSGPFKTAISYHGGKNAAGTKTDRLTTGGISYTMGPAKMRLGVASARYPSIPSNALVYDVGVDYTVSTPLVLSLDYVARNKKNSPSDTNFLRLRAVYAIDEAVSVYGNALYLNNKGTATEHFYGDGRPGQNQAVYGVGLQYVF